MTVNDLLPWVVGLYAVFFGLLIAILGGGYWFRGKLSKIDALHSSLTTLGDIIATQIQLTGIVIGGLRRQQTLGDAELTEIEKVYMKSHIDVIRYTIKQEKQTYNPLNSEELNKLNFYISKAEQGELFDHSEIEEYNILVQKVKEERGGIDPGVVALVGLGALLLGIWIGSRRQQP